jgi:putative phosphoesterase
VRVLVTSDTHVGVARRAALPAALLEQAEAADVILHGGDLVDPAILLELAAYAPVHAVRGNCDPLVPGLPERRIVELEGVAIGMVHDPGPEKGRRDRLKEWFPHCRVVVFGHTHLPVIDHQRGVLLLNPGSPTERRRAPFRSLAVLQIAGDGPVEAELVPLPDLGARA